MLTRSKKKNKGSNSNDENDKNNKKYPQKHLYLSIVEFVNERISRRHPDYLHICLKQWYGSKERNLIIV